MLLTKDVEEVVVDILGHCPWFTPVFNDVVKAEEWAIAMATLMPMQRKACEEKGMIPSPARLSAEFVLPRVEAEMTGEEIAAEWFSGKPTTKGTLRDFFTRVLKRFISFRIRNFLSRLVYPSLWEDKPWNEKE